MNKKQIISVHISCFAGETSLEKRPLSSLLLVRFWSNSLYYFYENERSHYHYTPLVLLQLENDKLQAQGQVQQLKMEIHNWFEEKHGLEKELKNVRVELDSLKSGLRNSGSSLDLSHGVSNAVSNHFVLFQCIVKLQSLEMRHSKS